MSDAFYKINALTQEQRDAAYDAARRRIAGSEPNAGAEPTLAAFLTQTHGKLPKKAMRAITALCLLMLIAAFLPSAMRLHRIAIDLARPVVIDAFSTHVAALCVVLMAEIGQVIFSLAAAALAQRKRESAAFWLGSILCLLIALIGNAVAEGNHATTNALAPLVTFAPPILVLITAQVLKSQLLHAMEERHAAAQAFEIAHDAWQRTHAAAFAAWQESVRNAHERPDWNAALANALWNALRSANKQSKAVLRALTLEDRRALVMRERSAEEWWQESERPIQNAAPERIMQKMHSGHTNGNSTGEVADATMRFEDDQWIKQCPICAQEFASPQRRKAINKFVAHMKKHRNQERDAVAGALPIAETHAIASANGNGRE